MLLCLSSRKRLVLEQPVEVAGEVALEAAACFAAALAFLDTTVDVGDRWRVRAASGDEDHVQCSVESAVAAQPAGRANAASLLTGPRCDQGSGICAAASGPTAGWSSSCGASL